MHRRLSMLCVGLISGCANRPEPPVAPIVPQRSEPTPIVQDAPNVPKEVFPGVFLDVQRKIVSFDATVAIDAHNDKTPTVYLEAIVCIKDTKEHESLVMTQARPSHIHAALLLAGFLPGAPGAFDWTGDKMNPIPPRGSEVGVRLIAAGANEDPRTWIKSALSGVSLDKAFRDAHFVFAGSRERTKQGVTIYDADFSGTLIGLSTFGTETIAFSHMLNPDAGIEDPVWIADAREVPSYGTMVRVEIGAIQR